MLGAAAPPPLKPPPPPPAAIPAPPPAGAPPPRAPIAPPAAGGDCAKLDSGANSGSASATAATVLKTFRLIIIHSKAWLMCEANQVAAKTFPQPRSHLCLLKP